MQESLFKFWRLRVLPAITVALLCSLASCSRDESTTVEYIVFASGRTGETELCIISPNGTEIDRLPTYGGFGKEPCLSIDGFIVYQTSSRQIRRVAIDGSNDVSLNVYGHAAEWSPDGQYIVYQGPGFDWDILLMDRDGYNILNLTDSPDTRDTWPTWSPDGQEILWQSQENLWLMNADGSGKRMIPGEKWYGRAELSPDGRRIVYTRTVGQRRCVFIMNSDGTDIQQLTTEEDEGYGDFEVTWSPNGKKLLFLRAYVVSYSDAGFPQEFQSDLCVLKIKSKSVTYLTTGPETNFCPSWKRVNMKSNRTNTILGY